MARRALDYLVGFNISPILWTKLPGSKSAGRVQSVALRLLTEREHEIEIFKPEEFWSLKVNFKTSDGSLITSQVFLEPPLVDKAYMKCTNLDFLIYFSKLHMVYKFHNNPYQ